MENNENPIINGDENNNNKLDIIPEEKTSDSASIKSSKSEDIKYEAEILKMPENYQPKNSLTFKIIIIGNSGVGKTSITNNAIKNIFFENYRATIGMEVFSLFLRVNHKLIKLQIWDTCGQEIYRSLITNFYRNASLAIIVYSIDKKSSFKDIDLWLKELRLNSCPDIKIILIGNKSDLNENREVSYEDGAKYLEDGCILNFYETSAKTGDNIKKIFEDIGIMLYKDYVKYKIEGSLKSNSTLISNKQDNKKKRGCC